MPIQLTPKAEALIREKVNAGLYDDAESAIDAAFNLLNEYDRRLQRLRMAIAEGETGEALPWTPELMDQILREADDMHSVMRKLTFERPGPAVVPAPFRQLRAGSIFGHESGRLA